MEGTHLHDLPDTILSTIFSLVSDVRSRNSMSLASHKWLLLERSTRSSLSLRGNLRDLLLLPASFSAVSHLDLSLLSPWGHPLLPDSSSSSSSLLLAHRLLLSFPRLSSLTLYSRSPSTLLPLSPLFPSLRSAALVRFHQRPPHLPLGSDLSPLLAASPSLSSLDLSNFYCWPEDIPAALYAHPSPSASLSELNLLNPSSPDGLRSSDLLSISSSCPNLRRLLAPCVFNPRYLGFVADPDLLALASRCPRLSLLHLADPAALSLSRSVDEAVVVEESRITAAGLRSLFAALPQLQDLALDLRHYVRDAGPALEALSARIKNLKLGEFRGICIAAGMHLDGVAVCGGLQSLCLKNCDDLADAGLVAIARGCRRLSKFEIHGCGGVTEFGIKKMAGMLRSTLVDVSISGCRSLDASASLRALEPIRDRIQRLHIDCIWVGTEAEQMADITSVEDFDADELQQDGSDILTNKKCRYSDEFTNHQLNGSSEFWCRSWDQLKFLSLWLPAGELLSPLPHSGLESCPDLQEICIKVEGDCRICPRPSQLVFGLSSLALYPKLSKMKLDCSDAIGYALTAPAGQMDLSAWERFYLHGIGGLDLYELDYWPPQDREVNQRSLSLPATGLIQGCVTLRKLFIHGTTHEHFMRFFLEMPRLRDVQLREDYYPAPENDMSTEMRVDSCSRFEDALNSRLIPP